jgi:hypothetical protein
MDAKNASISTCNIVRVAAVIRATLAATLNNEASKPAQGFGIGTEVVEVFQRAIQEFVAALSGYCDTRQAGVGRLVEALVRSGRFANDFRVSFNIKDVVLDLKCNSDRAAKGVKR